MHTAPKPKPVTKTEFTRYEVFPPFIHTCCLNCDGCEAAQVVNKAISRARARSFSTGSFRHVFSEVSQHSPTQLGRVGKPVHFHSRFQRAEKGASPSYSVDRHSFQNVGCLWSHTQFDVCVGDFTTKRVTLPPEQRVDSTYLRPLLIHPSIKFIFGRRRLILSCLEWQSRAQST